MLAGCPPLVGQSKMLTSIIALQLFCVDATVLYSLGGEKVRACTAKAPSTCQDIQVPLEWRTLTLMRPDAMAITDDKKLYVASPGAFDGKILGYYGNVCVASSSGGRCSGSMGRFRGGYESMRISMAAVGNDVYVADPGDLYVKEGRLYHCVSGRCNVFLDNLGQPRLLKFMNNELIFLNHGVVTACSLSGDCRDIHDPLPVTEVTEISHLEVTKDFMYTIQRVFDPKDPNRTAWLRARNISSGEYKSVGPNLVYPTALAVTEEAVFVADSPLWYQLDKYSPKVLKCDHGSSSCTEVFRPAIGVMDLAAADGTLFVANMTDLGQDGFHTSITACSLADGNCSDLGTPVMSSHAYWTSTKLMACESCELQDFEASAVV